MAISPRTVQQIVDLEACYRKKHQANLVLLRALAQHNPDSCSRYTLLAMRSMLIDTTQKDADLSAAAAVRLSQLARELADGGCNTQRGDPASD